MNVNDVSLPYPVLGIDDNITPLPITTTSFKADDKKYTFEFNFEAHNPEIQAYIDNGKAEYVCEVNCVSTFLRFCVKSKQPHIKVELKRNEVLNDISLFCAITLNEEIKGYTNKGFHEDYTGYSFDLGPGDLLAFFGEYHYDAGLQYDKLQATKQIMEIKCGRDGDDIKYNLATDKIEILLPPKLFEDYKENIRHKAAYAHILQASLVFNTLMYALFNIDENRTTLWARSILYRLANEDALKHFDLDDPEQIPSIVSAILDNPYSELFDCLETITYEEEEE